MGKQSQHFAAAKIVKVTKIPLLSIVIFAASQQVLAKTMTITID